MRDETAMPIAHLDADTFSAFAEGALPAHERDQALEHLASCARCRAILALSLPEEQPEPVAQPRIEPVRPRRTFQLWPVWAGAFAALALALVSVPLLLRHHGAERPSTQEARVEPLPPASAPAANEPPRAPEAAVRKLLKPRPPAAVPSHPLPSPSAIEEPSGGASRAVENAPGSFNSASAVALAPAPQPDANSRPSYSLRAEQKSAAPLAQSAAPAPPPMQANAAPKRRMAVAALPSHLPVASSATAAGLTLAIDTAGAAFLSRDSGETWSAVAGPWPAASATAITAPGNGFLLTTRGGTRWTGTDGEHWNPN